LTLEIVFCIMCLQFKDFWEWLPKWTPEGRDLHLSLFLCR